MVDYKGSKEIQSGKGRKTVFLSLENYATQAKRFSSEGAIKTDMGWGGKQPELQSVGCFLFTNFDTRGVDK